MLPVSVVIPTYNHGPYVEQAVRSVLAQTYPAAEVLVLDDGSTDDTAERLRAFGDRIRYVYHENRGRGATRNRGIELASHDWLAFLDADDLWLPEKLARQVVAVEAHPEIDFLVTDADQFDGDVVHEASFLANMKLMHDFPRREDGALWVFTEPMFPLFVQENFVIQSSVLMHRRCFERDGLYDPELKRAQDRDMWMRLSRHFTFAVIREVLVRQRENTLADGSGTAAPIEYRLKIYERCLARDTEWERKYQQQLRWHKGRTHFVLAYFYLRNGNPSRAVREHLAAAVADGYTSPAMPRYRLASYLPGAVRRGLFGLAGRK